MIGDSHTRGLTSELKNYLGHEYSISSTFMPGAGLQNIVNLAKNEITTLTKSDMVIICGGSNDISRNESQVGLSSLKNFVNLRTKSKVLILPPPHRHDLSHDSCVNKEIQSFNRKLRKIMKIKEMVKIIDYDITREGFTRHGQHLNSIGKSKLAQHIAQYLIRSFINTNTELIPMKWKTSILEVIPMECEVMGINNEKSDLNSDREEESQSTINNQNIRVSSRRKKNTQARSNEFLWE